MSTRTDEESVLSAARRYVGTDETSGRLQLRLLQAEGIIPDSRVLEIGCGCLHAALPLLRLLAPGRYVGVDPNPWLLEAALADDRARGLVERKRARFLCRYDFDASEFGERFDFVLSHSVLSHCSLLQLDQFLENAAAVLAPRGRVLASLRLAEGNPFGSAGSPDGLDSDAAAWRYPDVTWFRRETVRAAAERAGLVAVHRPGHTALYVRTRPLEMHDWFVFAHRQTK